MIDQEVYNLIDKFVDRLEKMSDKLSNTDAQLAGKIAETNQNLALTSQALAGMQGAHQECLAQKMKDKEVEIEREKERIKLAVYSSMKAKVLTTVMSVAMIVIGVIIEKYLR